MSADVLKKLDDIEWSAKEFAHIADKEDMLWLITTLRQHLQALEAAKRGLDFYATFRPFQFPEGYYETNIAKGEGGHVPFGTLAKRKLAEISRIEGRK